MTWAYSPRGCNAQASNALACFSDVDSQFTPQSTAHRPTLLTRLLFTDLNLAYELQPLPVHSLSSFKTVAALKPTLQRILSNPLNSLPPSSHTHIIPILLSNDHHPAQRTSSLILSNLHPIKPRSHQTAAHTNISSGPTYILSTLHFPTLLPFSDCCLLT